MIETTLYITLVTFQMSFPIIRTFGKGFFTITHSVRLDICFGYDIDTITIAEVIPEVIIGIVASAHRVQIELLHNLDILNHTFGRNDVTTVRIHLMAIGPLKEYRLAVYQYLRVLQFYLAETYLDGNYFIPPLQCGT